MSNCFLYAHVRLLTNEYSIKTHINATLCYYIHYSLYLSQQQRMMSHAVSSVTDVFRRHAQYRMIETVFGKEKLEDVVSEVEERNSRVADVALEVGNFRL